MLPNTISWFPKAQDPHFLPELRETGVGVGGTGAAPCRAIRLSGITHTPGSCPHLAFLELQTCLKAHPRQRR